MTKKIKAIKKKKEKKFTGKRKSKFYDSKSNTPFKISRSKFENFLKCPRCFYLDRVEGVNFPSIPTLSLNNLVDELLKKEFDVYREQAKSHPIFKTFGFEGIPFKHNDIDSWRNSRSGGVQYLDVKNNLILTGGIDDVWLDTTLDKLVVVDYKATVQKDGVADNILENDSYKSLSIQLDFYSWLFKKNNFEVADYGYFMFCNGIRTKDSFNKQLESEYKFIKYNVKTNWIEDKIFEMKMCLDSKTPPKSNEGCFNCKFVKVMNEY